MSFISTIDAPCALCGGSSSKKTIATKDFSYGTCENEFFYSECDCGVFRLVNQPLDEDMGRIYPENYSAYKPTRFGPMAKIRQWNFQTKIRDAIGKRKVDSWLDFGCGAGELVLVVKSLGVEKVFGCDFSDTFFEELRGNGVVCFLSNELSRLDDNSLDVVSMLQVIEHLRDPRRELDAIKSKLKIGGVLIVETPSPSGLDFKLGKNKTWGGWHAPRHFFIFSQIQLIEILEECGFKVISTKHIPSPYMWIETLKARMIVDGRRGAKSKMFSIGNIYLVAVVTLLDYASIALGKSSSNQQIVAIRVQK
jgi:SAM-dependent methyltransferase